MMTKNPELLLQVKVTSLDPARLRVDVRAENVSQVDLYWLNKFWTAKRGGGTEWDPRGPYRHEAAGILRLLYGAAPVPPSTMVNTRYIPHATKIPPGGSVDVRTEIALPVEEFALFEPATATTEYESVMVERVAVIAHYAAVGDGVVVVPSFIDPVYAWVKTSDQKLGVAEAVVAAESFAVRRRKDPITRTLLSTEKP